MVDRTHSSDSPQDVGDHWLKEFLSLVAERLASVEEAVRASNQADPHTDRNFYSVHEFAKLVDRSPYTVREWARHGRINAEKSDSGRGPERLWKIPASELQRFLDDGLYPE